MRLLTYIAGDLVIYESRKLPNGNTVVESSAVTDDAIVTLLNKVKVHNEKNA